MCKTTVVNIYKSPYSYNIYIGRAGKGQDGYFGNPFKLSADEPRGATLDRYKIYFDNRIATDPEFKQRIHELKGKVLGCFCKPSACHGDIIVNYLNNLTT